MIALVNELAGAAEAADYHPDIDIRWNKVTLALSTHAGRPDESDFQLAARIAVAARACARPLKRSSRMNARPAGWHEARRCLADQLRQNSLPSGSCITTK